MELTLAIQHCQQTDNVLAVAYIDLDGFGQINDTYGHAVGDQLLIVVAAQMKKICGETDTAGRIGGDEFVALLNVGKELNHSLHLVKRLLAHHCANHRESVIKVIIGLCFYPQAGEIHAEQLLTLWPIRRCIRPNRRVKIVIYL